MLRTVVDSSCIASIGYSADEQVLEIQFVSGSIYRYFHVPAEIHCALYAAESKGTFHNRVIRGRFHHELISRNDDSP